MQKEKEKKTNWRGLETTLRREEEDGEKKNVVERKNKNDYIYLPINFY